MQLPKKKLQINPGIHMEIKVESKSIQAPVRMGN
jgi:hypothetical protein